MNSEATKFSSIDWGPDEAKGDERLLQYFVPFPDFDNIRVGKLRYVIGRKGAGKTAIIERVRLELQDDPLFFNASLSLRNFPLHDFRDLRDRGYRDKAQFVSAWQFLIYVELAKLVCADEGATPSEAVDDLRRFLLENGLLDSLGFVDSVTTLRKAEKKVKVALKWLEGEKSNSEQEQYQTQVHFKQVVDLLLARLRSVKTQSQYWVFMDELDEGYRAGDSGLRLILLALLRAVEDSALALKQSGIAYRPLLVLRSDIFDGLEDNDLNKLDDHVLRLRWNSNGEHDPNSLRSVVNARIAASLPNLRGDLWSQIAQDSDPKLPAAVNSLWSYAVNRTYERPRDIIKFLKICGKKVNGAKLTFDAVIAAENMYSDWLYKEIRDEIHSHLPVWKEAMHCVTRAGTGKIKISRFRDLLAADIEIQKWVAAGNDLEKIIQTLFDFGVLGNLDNKRRWLFKYKDDDLAWNPGMDVIVHYGLHKKLRVLR